MIVRLITSAKQQTWYTKQKLHPTSNSFYKIYYGTSEGTFKVRYANHKKSFKFEKYRTDTQLSKEYWRLKELNALPQMEFYILKMCPPTRRTGSCYLCLNEKLFILEHKGNNLLNKRNELISKCRHKNKFKLANQKTWRQMTSH